MDRLHWGRIALSGLLAGLVWNLLAMLLLGLVGDAFLAEVRRGPGGGTLAGIPFGFLANLAAGIWAMWLYGMIHPRFRTGPRAAAVAGCAWWVIVSLQSGKWVALQGVPLRAVIGPLLVTLPAILLATQSGALTYRLTLAPRR